MNKLRSTTIFGFAVSASILWAVSTVVVSGGADDTPAKADDRTSGRDDQSEKQTPDPQSSTPTNPDPNETPLADDAEAAEKASFESPGNAKIAHGKYLVHHVAQCIQCHTPRDDGGGLVKSRLLSGAPIPVSGPRYARPWAAESACIAGLGSYDEAFVRYLLTRFKGKVRDVYLELIQVFPLTSIRSEDDHDAAQEVMDRLLAKGKLSSGEEIYLDALSDLIAAYEDEHYRIEPPSDAEMLRHLMEVKGVNQIELHRGAKIAKSTISEVLAGKKAFSRQMIRALADFFSVDKSVLTGNL